MSIAVVRFPARALCKPLGVLAIAGLLVSIPARADTGAAWQSYIAHHAMALDGPEDTAHLLPVLRAFELVLLGETTHGTHEYYVARAALSRALIAEAGFRFIAVEGDWAAIDRLDRYVRHKRTEAGSARAVLETFDRWAPWMWANPVIEELAEWLHAWNAGRPPEERAGIHGIDVYGWGDSVALLPDILEELEAGWGEDAIRDLAALQRLSGDNHAFYQAVMRNQPTGAEALARWRARLDDAAGTLRADTPYAWMQARQQASLIQHAKRHLRKNVQRHPRSWNPRAENFMQTIMHLRDYYGEDARGIVWAHNTHIGDARQTPMGPAGMINVGQQARERLGRQEVFLLGFASDRGSFRAGRSWGAPGEEMPLATALNGTFDAALREAAPAHAFLPLAAARGNALLTQPIGHRAIGIVHDGGSSNRHSYVPSIIPLRYDGIFFIRQTQALNALDQNPP